MINRNYVVRLIIILSVLCHGIVLGTETVAVVLKASGKVQVSRDSLDKPVQVKRGFRLQNGDQLETGKNSSVALRFIDDASLVRLRENTICQFTLDKKDTGNDKSIFLEVGAILTEITRQKGEFQVATPTSVASVKGTGFITDHGGDGTYYHGESGQVGITNDTGEVILTLGFTVFVKSRQSPLELRKTLPGEKPDFGDRDEKLFEMEFEDADGKTKTLKFKVK